MTATLVIWLTQEFLHRNIMNMSLGTFINGEHYRNVMNMFCWNITSRSFKHFINEKHLGHTDRYEHVLLEYYLKEISNIYQ